jgi:hypothetical protein
MRAILPGLIVLAMTFGGGYLTASLRRKQDPRIVALREHARLLEKAGRASRRGQHGLAEIYEHGAQEALDLVDEPKELGP